MNSELGDLYAAVGAAVMHGHLVYAEGEEEISEVESSGMFEKLGTIVVHHEVHNVYRYVGKKSSTPISDEFGEFIRNLPKPEKQTIPSIKPTYPWDQSPYQPYPGSDHIWTSSGSPLQANWLGKTTSETSTSFRGYSL